MNGVVRKILSWVLASVLLAIAVAVSAEWFIEVLKQKGFYTGAADHWDRFAGRAAKLALSLPVLLSAAFLAGLVTGLWSARLSGKKRKADGEAPAPAREATEESHREQRTRLSRLMDSAIRSADAALREGTPAAYQHALPGLESTLLTIGGLYEIPTPDLRSSAIGPREGLKRAMDFLVQVGPLLDGGHIDEARRRARTHLTPTEDG
jgi:hypothetical protein